MAGEAAGGGVPPDGGVGVARRGHGAERGRGVHGGGRLVAVVGVPGGALDVVDGVCVRGGERGGEEGARLVTSESVLACGILILICSGGGKQSRRGSGQ